jgi:hypothetical protein
VDLPHQTCVNYDGNDSLTLSKLFKFSDIK